MVKGGGAAVRDRHFSKGVLERFEGTSVRRVNSVLPATSFWLRI